MAKYRSLSVPVKASFFFIFCGAFKDLVDVIATPIFTRILTTDEYGLFTIYNSWYQIVRIFTTLGLYLDGFNVGMSRFDDDHEGYVSSQQGLLTFMLSIWTVGCFAFHRQLDGLFQLGPALLFLMLAQSLFSACYAFWYQKSRYTYKYVLLTIVTLIYTTMQPLLGIMCIKHNSFGLDNGVLRIYTGVGVQIAAGVITFVIQFIRKPVFFRKKYWVFGLKTNIVLLPYFLSQIVLNQSDKLMIERFWDKSKSAIYSVAHSAAFVIFVIVSNLNSTLIPWLYSKLKARNYTGIKRIINILVLLAAISVAALVLIAPEAMKIMGGGEYYEGLWVIPPLTYSVYLIFVYMLFSNIELYYGKNSFVLISSVIGTAANLLLNYWFIPIYGFIASGYTTMASYIIICICHYLFLCITCKKSDVSVSQLFNILTIVGISTVLAVICTAIMLLYNTHSAIRYILLLAVLFILFIRRRSLIQLYKDLKKKMMVIH